MAKMGRPKINIDKKIFENLCAIQCTEIEICGCFDCCEDTLNKWCKENYRNEDGKPMTFSEVFAEKRQKGRASLRRLQWRLAETSATMAIFLGKQYLGQKNEPLEVQHSVTPIDAITQEIFEIQKEQAAANAESDND